MERNWTGDDERRCRERLEACGMSATTARMAVYRLLVESDDHPTAQQLQRRLADRLPNVSQATLYNSLEALVEANLIGKVGESTRAVRYDAEVGRHHHLICRSCGTIVDLHDDGLDRITPPKTKGFRIDDHSVHFYGHCDDCDGGRGIGA